jgi:hypothetical protein
MPSRIAAELVARWSIQIADGHGAVRYCTAGNWYHPLTRFPGALLDPTAYVVFESERTWRECRQLKIGPKGDVGIPGGIRNILGHRLMASSLPSSASNDFDRRATTS